MLKTPGPNRSQTGGSIDNTPIGANTPSTGAFTTLNTTGFFGVGTASPSGPLQVNYIAYNPGTVAVNGTAVTGTGTSFTTTFTIGQSITTTTSSGSETKEIISITSDTAMTVVSAFAGTNSGASYTSSNTGSQLRINPNGTIRPYGSTGNSNPGINDWILKNNVITQTGSEQNTALRDQTTITQTSGTAGNVNTFVCLTQINGVGGNFGPVRGFNSAPTVLSTNTGNITTIAALLSATQIQSGATGTITNHIGALINPTNSSTTNTVTNQYGVQIAPTQNGGTLTNYAGIAIAAKPTAATNSSLVLLGTTAIPSGSYSIYNASTLDSYLAGTLSVAGANMLVASNGNVTNTNNSYGAISDLKLKENIRDCGPLLAKLQKVRIVNYTLKTAPDHKQLGVIAQELEQVFPGMIEESPDFGENGEQLGTFTKSVKYSVFVPMLIKAMQEQQQVIDRLTAKIEKPSLIAKFWKRFTK